MKIPKFRDIAKNDMPLPGEKMSLQDIVGKTIIATGYDFTKSKFSDATCLKLQFEIVG